MHLREWHFESIGENVREKANTDANEPNIFSAKETETKEKSG